jgi:hypothetical protein
MTTIKMIVVKVINVSDLSNQLDLFPTSEPEIKGQLAAFAMLLRSLIETLIANGSLTAEHAKTLLHHSDLKSVFPIWDETEGSAPDNERKRMEEQAARFLESLRRDLFSPLCKFCFLGQKPSF